MKKIIKILKEHKWAIILAFITAVIIAYPQIHFRYNNADVYQGIELMGAPADETAWLSRVREVQDGHPSLSCVYYKDGKNDPYLLQPLGTMTVAYLGKIFSLDINNTLLLARSLLSFLVFLIIYAFVFLFSKGKLTALTAATALILGRDIFVRGGIMKILTIGSPSTSFLGLMRVVNPLMTYFFFFGFLLFFWLFLERKQWRFGISSAVLLGLSFYDFFYTWTFLYASIGILLLVFLCQKRWQDAKRIILVVSLATLIAVPYLINLYQVTTYPIYQEVALRFGMIEGRAPILGILAPAIFLAILIFFPRRPKDRYFFALSLAAALLIVLNQQLVIGQRLNNAHYHWYFAFPLAIIFLFVMVFAWLPRIKLGNLMKVLTVLTIVFFIYIGILVQSASYAVHENGMIEKQRYGPLMDWLNKNAEKEEVVFSNDETARLIVIYTPLNVFYHRSVKYCLAASEERLMNTLFLYYRLEGIDKNRAASVFFKDRENISSAIYGLHYRELTGDYEGIPDEVIKEFSRKYQESLSLPTSEFLNNLWTQYEVEYLVWDTAKNPKWQLDQYPFLERVAEIGDFVIYQIKYR